MRLRPDKKKLPFNLAFSKDEIRDIVVSVIALIVVFTWMPFPRFGLNIALLPYFAVIVIFAFVFHELAHKAVAMRFGLAAFYKMWPQGILIGLVLMILGLRFVAPGAVVVYPYRFGRWGYRRTALQSAEMGAIAAAGPLTNIIFAIIFSLFDGTLFFYLTFINGWLAFFNLLPVPPLDGSKVLIWKPWIWGMLATTAFILFIRTASIGF